MEQPIDMCFPIRARKIPSEHGYLLFSALAAILPQIHTADDIAIHTIPGVLVQSGEIRVSDNARIRIRVPLRKIPEIYKLAGKRIFIGDYPVAIRYPEFEPLCPISVLRSRLVVIKSSNALSYLNEEIFRKLAEGALGRLGIAGELSLEQVPLSSSDPEHMRAARRIVRVKGVSIPGYGVVVSGLSPQDSLRLQAIGLGGRRKMGCGIFLPVV